MDPNNPMSTPPASGDPNQPQVQPTAPAPQPGVVGSAPMAGAQPVQQPVQQPMQQPMQQSAPPQMAPIGGPHMGGGSKLPMIVIAVIAVLVLGGGGFLAYKLTSNSGSKSNESLLAEDKKVTKEGKVGSTVDLEGLEITVSATEKKEQLGEYTKPKVGHIFVVATIKVENKTDHEIKASAFDFKFLTADGQKLTGSSVYESSEQLPSAGIVAGGSGLGLVEFEVPVDKVDDGFITYDYTYYPEDYTKSQIIYSLKVAL